MSTQIESIFDYQTPVANNKKPQKNQQEEQGAAAAFAAFLTRQTSDNSVFNRMTANLDLPQASQPAAEKFAAPDTRPEPRQDRNPAAETARPAREDSAPRERMDIPRSETASQRANQNAPEQVQANGRQRHDNASTTQSQNADATARNPGTNTGNSQAQNSAAGTNAADQKQAAAVQGKPPPQATEGLKAGADTTVNTANAEQTNSKPASTASASGKATSAGTANSESTIKASVTTQSGAITSKPNANLASESSVKVDMSGEGANNIVGKANNQNAGNGANTQQQGQNQGNPNNMAANAGQQLVAANNGSPAQSATPGTAFNNAMAAAQPNLGAREAALANISGSSGQMATVDPLTGTTAVEGQNGSIQRSSAAPASHARRPQVPPQVIADQVAVNIQRAVGQGNDRINIQLRPQELGRIDVKMEMGQDGRMTASITVEKPETLDMLRSDARNLIQTLNDAGLQTDSNSLNFSLQGQDSSGQQQTANGDGKASSSKGEEFSLDGEPTPTEDSPILADGEDVTLDQDGHLNVRV